MFRNQLLLSLGAVSHGRRSAQYPKFSKQIFTVYISLRVSVSTYILPVLTLSSTHITFCHRHFTSTRPTFFNTIRKHVKTETDPIGHISSRPPGKASYIWICLLL